MKKISKVVSIILLIAIMLPGIVDASNVDSIGTETDNPIITEQSEKNDIEESEEVESEEVESEARVFKVEAETQVDESEKMNLKASTGVNKHIERINGSNRIETSIEVSQAAYSGKVETVLLAGHDGEADALTATFVAGQQDAPLLLTYQNRLDPKLKAELKRLNPEEIVILGGENVIGESVSNELAKEGYKVNRIKGDSRIETAINVASSYYSHPSGLEKATEVFMIEYDSLVDALAIGPVAARDGIPILIMRRDSVPAEVSKFLKEKAIKKVTIVGGKTRISNEGKNEIVNIVGADNVKRIEGSNRIQTSITICEDYFTNPENIVVANGQRYTDALIGGYFAAKKNAPIILTGEGQIPEYALECIEKATKAYILGGKAVVDDNMFNMIKGRLDPNYTYVKPVVPAPKPEVKPDPAPKPEVKPDPTPTPGKRIRYSTTADLNMRSGIGVSNQILLKIPRGGEVSFISKHDGWSKIKYDNKEGYVNNYYLKIEMVSENEPVLPVPKPEPKPDKPVKPGQPMVCLDYGHGGSDPGAVYLGRREKDDTMKMGKLVAKDLRRHGVMVDETRTTDRYVGLTARSDFANKKNYNYFVSFHRNAFSSELANGAEVWTTAGSSWKSKSLAKSIQSSLVRVGYTNRGVKHENFTVLAKTRAPAVLIELGFISNASDNKLYDRKEKEIVKGVTSSILGELGIKYKN